MASPVTHSDTVVTDPRPKCTRWERTPAPRTTPTASTPPLIEACIKKCTTARNMCSVYSRSNLRSKASRRQLAKVTLCERQPSFGPCSLWRGLLLLQASCCFQVCRPLCTRLITFNCQAHRSVSVFLWLLTFCVHALISVSRCAQHVIFWHRVQPNH